MFSEQTIDFLMENRFHNDREWFHEHRADYLRLVHEPLVKLVEALAPAISAVDPEIISEPRTDKTISRIYRDTRFSKDKSLYRAEMWLSFKRDRKAFPCYPEFYFDMSPEGWGMGCGYYVMSNDALTEARRRMLAGDEGFAAMQRVLRDNPGYVLGGERYRRSKFPDQPEEMREWLDRKSYHVFMHSDDFSTLYSPDLGEKLAAEVPKFAPVYRFFLDVELKLLAEKYRQ